MSDWRPIETAPKARIVGTGPGRYGRWVMDLWWNDGEFPGWYDTYDHDGPHEPDHWLPMPSFDGDEE